MRRKKFCKEKKPLIHFNNFYFNMKTFWKKQICRTLLKAIEFSVFDKQYHLKSHNENKN